MRILTALVLVLGVNLGHANFSSERSIAGKIVAVTGAAQGIGLKIASYFLKNHAKLVFIIDINQTRGQNATDGLNKEYGNGKAMFICADVTKDLEYVKNTIYDMVGVGDVVVNNAGIVDEYDAERTIKTNLLATIQWSMAAFELFRKDKGGKGGTIINVSGIYDYTDDPFCPFYKAAAHGITGYTKTLGHEYIYRTSGVRMVTVSPGYTYTEMTRGQITTDEYADQMAKYKKHVNWQTAEDVGRGTMEIFKKAKSGSTWSIDGGKVFESPDNVYVSADFIESM